MQQIVVLARSRKNGGYCLAGKRAGSLIHDWIRPVSALPGQAWPNWMLKRKLRREIRIGQLLALPFKSPSPTPGQPENYLVGNTEWAHLTDLDGAALDAMCDSPAKLWDTGWHTVYGDNDRVPETPEGRLVTSSLYLIEPHRLRFHLAPRGSNIGVRATFVYRSTGYDLAVTDCAAEKLWIERLVSGHSGHATALLTISLGLPFQGYRYKLVAGVIAKETP